MSRNAISIIGLNAQPLRIYQTAQERYASHPKFSGLAEAKTTAEFLRNFGLCEEIPKVTILVGKEHKKYTVSQDAICKGSEFIAAAFKYKAPDNQVLNLEHIKVESFEPCLQWILTGDMLLSTVSVEKEISAFAASEKYKGWKKRDIFREFKKEKNHLNILGTMCGKFLRILQVADELILNPSPAFTISNEFQKLIWKYWHIVGPDPALVRDAYSLLPSWNPFRKTMTLLLIPYCLNFGFEKYKDLINDAEDFAKDLSWAITHYLGHENNSKEQTDWVQIGRAGFPGSEIRWRFRRIHLLNDVWMRIHHKAKNWAEKDIEFPPPDTHPYYLHHQMVIASDGDDW